MSMKGSLLLVVAIILLSYMTNECEAIQCYSCSDCNNATKSNWDIIQTMNSGDQCMKATIFTQQTGAGQSIINRGASSRCPKLSIRLAISSISCCSSDLCNV